MNANSSLDRESFQQFLAAAFAVQESRMDTQSLSAVIEIQRLVASGDLDANVAVQVIAERTQNVANAAGVAIALLQGSHLVYLAGIGSASPYVGRHITATLTVSPDTRATQEILRVENAQSDARIQAAICRQLGAESLLIMPIYKGKAVTGVLEVLFSEAHAFQDREVRAYRLMAGLLGEALSRAAQPEEAIPVVAPSIVSNAVDPSPAQLQKLPIAETFASAPEPSNAIYQIYEAALAATGKLPALWRLPVAATRIRQRVAELPLTIPQWTAVAAAMIALVIFGLSSHTGRRSAASAVQTPNFVDQQAYSGSVKPAAAKIAPELSTGPAALKQRKGPRSAFKRVRVGENEIDYVADDVTVRYFTRSPVSRSARVYNQVEIGKDVTVRYFAPVSATEPLAGKKSVPPKLVR